MTLFVSYFNIQKILTLVHLGTSMSLKSGATSVENKLILYRYTDFADDAIKLFKSSKKKIYDFPSENPQFKIIVSKDSDDKAQFHAIEPNNETTVLGEGQSIVFLGINIKTGEKVAIKKLKPISPAALADFERERENLKETGEFIGKGKETEKSQLNPTFYTIMKLRPGVNLLDLLYMTDPSKKGTPDFYVNKNKLSYKTKLELTIDVLSVTKRLHKKMGLLHRDIKSANFQTYLLGKRQVTTLLDLGSAVKKSEQHKEIAGSFGYLPPECLLPQKTRPPYDVLSEIFALAVVLAEIWTDSNYQANLLKHVDGSLSLMNIKNFLSDIFDASAKFDDPVEEPGFRKISRVISEMMKDIEDRDYRLSISRASKIVRKLYSEITKLEIEKTEPKLKSFKEAEEFAKEKLARYKDMRRNSSPSLPRMVSSPGAVSPREKRLSSADAFAALRRQSVKTELFTQSSPYLPSGGPSTLLVDEFAKLSLKGDSASVAPIASKSYKPDS